ncbi:MAG: prepilin peptidase [Patescibacteria group bacterium]|nr:prepilin peptidase [Patescibacteria group bacterium]
MMTLFLGVIGLFIGSFLGVIIDRLPQGTSIIFGRSRCDHCRKTLRWFELIPVVSFILQRARCLRCGAWLSWKYPSIEILTGALFIIVWFATEFSIILFIPAIVVACSLLVITIIDMKHMIIPDSLIVSLIIGSLAYQIFRFESFELIIGNYFLTAVGSYVVFYILWEITKRKGIGFGDVKLSFALGLLIGYPRVIISLYLAFLTGAFIAIILIIVRKKTMKSPIPFGPFLIIGALFSLFIDSEKFFSLFV